MRMVKDLELNKGGMSWDLEIWGFDQIIFNSFLSFLFLDPHDTSLSFEKLLTVNLIVKDRLTAYTSGTILYLIMSHRPL